MVEQQRVEIDRRQALMLGLTVAATGVLGGCSGGGGLVETPGPQWPTGLGKDPGAGKPIVGKMPPPVVNPPVQAPTGVIPRSAWTSASVIASRCNPLNGVSRITVHHAAVDNSDLRSSEDVKRRLGSIRQNHMNRRPEPFGDIGYHYIIDPQGRIWEGRPLRYQGAHVADQNEHNLGIMLLGDFTKQQPTNAAINSLNSFLIQQMRTYGVPVSRVYTHREIGKSSCPGANLQSPMVQMRGPGGSLRSA